MQQWRPLHFALLGLACALAACSTVQTPSKADPFEEFNRTVFKFNQKVDQVAVKPVAKTYKRVLPVKVRASVTNFFANIGDFYTMANDLLQGNIKAGAEDMMRITINSLFGVAGLFDVASEAHLPKHQQDFGRTLGFYGVHSGPYLVLPLFGPSTVRDTVGFVIDRVVDPTSHIHPEIVRDGLYVSRLVNTRALLLQATNLFSNVAFDQYSFERDAFLQHRRYLIHGESTSFDDDEDEDGDGDEGNALATPAANQAQSTAAPGTAAAKAKRVKAESVDQMTVPPSQMMPPINYFPNFRLP